MKDENTVELLGQTIDDAIGEAFDKPKLIGLSYPGGAEIEREALDGDETIYFTKTISQ